MTSVITNSNLDTKASEVAAPYGPLTRVGDAASTSPNSHIEVEFTSALSVSVFVSYDDFVDGKVARILEDAHAGIGQNVPTFRKALYMSEFIYRWMAAKEASVSYPPYLDADTQTVVSLFAMNPDLVALSPNYSERPADRIEIAFALTDAGSQAVDVVNTTTGNYDFIMWDYGDDTYVFTTSGNPADHTYSGAGSKTVTATAIGRGGIARLAKAVTIA